MNELNKLKNLYVLYFMSKAVRHNLYIAEVNEGDIVKIKWGKSAEGWGKTKWSDLSWESYKLMGWLKEPIKTQEELFSIIL